MAPVGYAAALTAADRRTFQWLALMEVRRPEVETSASFADAADEDPLAG
ncbi:MAG TPA: hypothetical protein VMK13_07645 [Streptosporangiaceae bacterium]|nr:hypothetical protein [Streptosporangiaceae bacterium]